MLNRRLTKPEFIRYYQRVLKLVIKNEQLNPQELAERAWQLQRDSRMTRRNEKAGRAMLWTVAHGFVCKMLNIAGKVGNDIEAAWRSFRVMQAKTLRAYQTLRHNAINRESRQAARVFTYTNAATEDNMPVLAVLVRTNDQRAVYNFDSSSVLGCPAVSYPSYCSDAKNAITAMLYGLEKINELAKARL
jgi:hypothetical protein